LYFFTFQTPSKWRELFALTTLATSPTFAIASVYVFNQKGCPEEWICSLGLVREDSFTNEK